MSSIKQKRKYLISDDEEDDDVVRKSKNGLNKQSKNIEKNISSAKNAQKRKKRIVIESDEENDSADDDLKRNLSVKKTISHKDEEDDGLESINDIKKQAKARAKKLAKQDENLISSSSHKNRDEKKTPPSDSKQQKNNILNYFQRLNSNDSKKKIESKIETEKSIGKKNESNEKLDSKSNRKIILDDDGYMHTNVVAKSRHNSEQKKSPKKQSEPIKIKSTKSPDQNESSSKIKRSETPIQKEKMKTSDTSVERSKKIDQSVKNDLRTKSPRKSNEISVAMKDDVKVSKKSHSEKISKPSSSSIVPSSRQTQPEPKRISELWVDKYKPINTKQIIGQQGDKSSLNKLIKWLKNWHQNLDKKPGFGKFSGSDDGSGFRAALLSGPPGVGKTTSARLVCQELGYDSMELNASDTRSKKALQEKISDLLENTKLTNFFKVNNDHSQSNKITAKHCLIMDEVDGIAGNEDRGGVAELIQLIKTTKIPIICICNDRGHEKIRSLVNYCFDLRYYRPRLEQIRAFLMSIAFKENVKVSADVLNELIVSSNYDVRQCIHSLYMLTCMEKQQASMKTINNDGNRSKMFDCDKSDLFFCDYSLMPLFVYENYLNVNLSSKEKSIGKQLKRLYKTIDSLSYGDLVEKEIRTNQSWSLLPIQAAFSTVMPCSYIRSENGLGFPQFPQFMGKLSTTNKNRRIVEELNSHMKLSTSGSKKSLILEYLPILRNNIVNAMVTLGKNGISSVVDLLEYYDLTKDDMDTILDISVWANETDPMKKVDSQTKSALTRALNKSSHSLPYYRENDIKLTTKGKASKSKKGKKKQINSDSEDDFDDEMDAIGNW
uniref:Replication factor C subunit 1 n=1 Tax=Sarcoptes scabiei TaxID=52283 RepID=A0A834RC26_SARSC